MNSLGLEMENWLQQAGYQYQCFISWPRTQNPDVTECARMLKKHIQQWLALSFSNPQVFLDETDVIGGDKWEAKMSSALCRSMALIAVCAPMYYHPSHKWCGIEWASMEELHQKRIPQQHFHSIIPIIVRHSELLPEPVKRIQYHDMSRLITSGRRYFTTKAYREIIGIIVSRIEEIAVTLAKNSVLSDCDRFQLSSRSAFSDYHVQPQLKPFKKVNLL